MILWRCFSFAPSLCFCVLFWSFQITKIHWFHSELACCDDICGIFKIIWCYFNALQMRVLEAIYNYFVTYLMSGSGAVHFWNLIKTWVNMGKKLCRIPDLAAIWVSHFIPLFPVNWRSFFHSLANTLISCCTLKEAKYSTACKNVKGIHLALMSSLSTRIHGLSKSIFSEIMLSKSFLSLTYA